MKRILFTVFPLLFIVACEKENLIEEVKQEYENGNQKVVALYAKQGLFFRELRKKKYFSEDGSLERIEEYKGKIPDGKWTYYDENGNISREETYIEGKRVEANGS